MEGDEILKINGKKINIYHDLAYAVMREGAEPVEATVIRSGEKIVVVGVKFPVVSEGGMKFGIIDFETTVYAKTFTAIINQTFFQSLSTIDMVWTSLFDLLAGKYGIEAVEGPVGITQVIGNSAKEATESKSGSINFLSLIALITINLGIVNLMPLPALDGGRIIFLLIELARRKPIKPEHEGYIHLAGFAALILFMIFVTYKDIMKLIVG
jgi:regulator of sigma E protease